MKNNSNLESLVLNNVLSASEMMLVKGGVSVSVSVSVNVQSLTKAACVVTVNSTNADDKRRERPGGGITSL